MLLQLMNKSPGCLSRILCVTRLKRPILDNELLWADYCFQLQMNKRIFSGMKEWFRELGGPSTCDRRHLLKILERQIGIQKRMSSLRV